MANAPSNVSDSKEALGEVAQAKIRAALHILFVILTFTAHKFDPRIPLDAVIVISIASFVSAISLYLWAARLQATSANLQERLMQRSACIVSDNLFVTLVLAIGGQSTAGLWTIYLWTSIGYGVRYGVQYLRANVAVSTVSYLIMAYMTPFWHQRPAFVLGMSLGMILVPIYTGILIRQLHKAVQDRETAYKAKSEFLARMSHELRTPLHAIIATAELLKRKSDADDVSDYVDTIALSSTTLLELINRVLDLSKFESGHVGLANEPIDVHALLAEVANLFFQQGQLKALEIRIYADPAIPRNLVGSPVHVREVLLNILGNAVKFTDHGFVSLSAKLISDSPSNSVVRYEVADTGSGIPQRDIGRIFEPFVQSDQSITRKHGGTGLGTSFSREIIRLMGGEISISSTEGLGTDVRFSIPYGKSAESEAIPSLHGVNIAILGSGSLIHLLRKKFDSFGAAAHDYQTTAGLTSSLLGTGDAPRIDAVIVDADVYSHLLPTIPAAVRQLPLARIVPVFAIGSASLRTVAVTSGYCSYVSTPCIDSQLQSIISLIHAFSKKGVMTPSAGVVNRITRPLNVLVADDNATNRKIAKIALEDAGHKCTLVTNGDDALFALNDVAYDVALLDMHMPGRDGIEVAKIYRFAGFARERPIPIILLTADTTNEARDEAESAGVSRFLTKPILPSEIVRAVEMVVCACDAQGTDLRVLGLHYKPVSTLPDSEHINSKQKDMFSEQYELLDSIALVELISLMSKSEQVSFFAEFCEDAVTYINILESVSRAADVPAAKDAMHALAGAALIIGANQLAHAARSVEKSEVGSIVVNRAELVARLRTIYELTSGELDRRFFPPHG